MMIEMVCVRRSEVGAEESRREFRLRPRQDPRLPPEIRDSEERLRKEGDEDGRSYQGKELVCAIGAGQLVEAFEHAVVAQRPVVSEHLDERENEREPNGLKD